MILRRLIMGILTLILALIGIFYGSQSQAFEIQDEVFFYELSGSIGSYLPVQNLMNLAQIHKYEIDPSKRTLIIFTASYCQACKSFVPKIEELEIVKNKQINLVILFLPGSTNKEIAAATSNEFVNAVGYYPTKESLNGFVVPALPRMLLLESDGCMLKFEHPISAILQPNILLE